MKTKNVSTEILNGYEDLMSVKDVAQALRMSKSGVAKMIRLGKLDTTKIGAKRLIFKQSIIDMIIKNSEPATVTEAE
jgi:excisionase family DNA binding protein